jgi:microcystin-dependent protein
MRKILPKILLMASIAMTAFSSASFGQGMAINSDGSAADANAILDVKSTTKGFLPPRLTAAQRSTLASTLNTGQTGMQVADATTGALYYWNGTAWTAVAGGGGTYTGTAPISVNSSTNTISLNAGTTAGDLITWDGLNWVSTQPATQHFSVTANNRQPYLALNYQIAIYGIYPSHSSSDPYIGEIMITGWNFATTGFALCNGQLLSIASNTALFSLIGTYYGGNGSSTFGLPDLRGRVPVHYGTGPGLSNYSIGNSGGSETITISQ